MKQSILQIGLYSLVIASLVGFNCSDNQNTNTSNNEEGVLFSDIEFVNLDGTPFNLEAITGKAVFLNIWATWCKPCIAEMPSIERAYQQLKDSEIVFLLASDESISQIQEFQNNHSYSFQFVQLKSGLGVVQSYALPTTLLFDHNGNLVSTERGAKEWDDPKEIKKLQELFKKQ